MKNLVMGAMAIVVSACQPPTATSSDSDAAPCQTHSQPFSYSVCRLDTHELASDRYSLELHWQDGDDTLLTFKQLMGHLPEDQRVAFAVNAGMYNDRYAPIGYTVIAGQEIRQLNLNAGGGNFHLLPNGVLWWSEAGEVHITESHALDEQIARGDAQPYFATQSGPLLVIDGAIHPSFNPQSQSRKYRNGVGVCNQDRIYFVHSDEPVNFYDFATLFKTSLGCDNALFLDGGVASALYAPSINRYDKQQMGVMIAMIEHVQ